MMAFAEALRSALSVPHSLLKAQTPREPIVDRLEIKRADYPSCL